MSGGGYLEDPCASLEGMAEVRLGLMAEGIETPLASNVAVTCFADVPIARKLDAVQIVLSDPHYWGGLRQVQSLSHLCLRNGRNIKMKSAGRFLVKKYRLWKATMLLDLYANPSLANSTSFFFTSPPRVMCY